MKNKKTVAVADILERVNHMLSLNIPRESKEPLTVLIESILMESGNYEGFRSLFNWNAATDSERHSKEYNRFYYVSESIRDDYNKAESKRDADGFRR